MQFNTETLSSNGNSTDNDSFLSLRRNLSPELLSLFDEGFGSNPFANAFSLFAIEFPQEDAIVQIDSKGEVSSRTTFELLNLNVRKVSAFLSNNLKVKRGESVGLCFPPCVEFIITFFGCVCCGIVPVPVYPPDPSKAKTDCPRFLDIVCQADVSIVLTNSFYKRVVAILPTLSSDSRWSKLKWCTSNEMFRICTETEALGFIYPKLNPDDVAFLQYTSGSTGAPKGVMVTMGGLIHNSNLCVLAFGFDNYLDENPPPPSSQLDLLNYKRRVLECHKKSLKIYGHRVRCFSWLPVYHDMGLIGFVCAPLLHGGCLYQMSPIDFIKNPPLWLECMSRYECAACAAPSFAYELITKKVTSQMMKKLDLSHVIGMLCGAEPIRPHVVKNFLHKFSACGLSSTCFIPAYGLAENTLIVTAACGRKETKIIPVDEELLDREGRAVSLSAGLCPEMFDPNLKVINDRRVKYVVSLGLPLLDGAVRIVNPVSLREVAEDSIVGEIWVSSDSTACGYIKNGDATKSTFFNQCTFRDGTLSKREFLRSGDSGFIIGSDLIVAGRIKDVLIIRGKNYYPQDIETLVELDSRIRPGSCAAYSIEIDGLEKPCITAEIRDTLINPNPTVVGNLFSAVRGLIVSDTRESELCCEIADDIKKRVSDEIGLEVFCVALASARKLPKTSSGKIRRSHIRERLLANTLHGVLFQEVTGYSEQLHELKAKNVISSPTRNLWRDSDGSPINKLGGGKESSDDEGCGVHHYNSTRGGVSRQPTSDRVVKNHSEKKSLPSSRAKFTREEVHQKLIDVVYTILKAKTSKKESDDDSPRESMFMEAVNELKTTDDRGAKELLERLSITYDTPLFNLGLDSITFIELTGKIGDTFDMEIDPMRLFEHPTLNSLIDFIYEWTNDTAGYRDGLLDDVSSEFDYPDGGPPATVQLTHHQVASPPWGGASEDLVIVSTSCRLPNKVNDIRQFWNFLASGGDCIKEIPRERWNIDEHYSPDVNDKRFMYIREGGFMEDGHLFDAKFFGIPHQEAKVMDPQQRLLLECGYEALYLVEGDARAVRQERVGVFVGSCCHDWSSVLQSNEKFVINSTPLLETLSPILHHDTIVSAYSAPGISPSLLANRISFNFGLVGPSMTIDTACSSSLVALQIADASIRSGHCSYSLVASSNLILSPTVTKLLCRAGLMSPDGRCKPFDSLADGYTRSEGVLACVLMPLDLCLKKKLTPLCSIRGHGLRHGGKAAHLTAPQAREQMAAMRDALHNSRLSPNDLDYIEAHGTGTKLGDPIEIDGIRRIFGKTNTLVVGSVKSNLGHLEGAAGMAGLFKCIMMLHHQAVPATIHLKNINPYIDVGSLTLPSNYVPKCKLVNIGINSFGFGGSNSHVIIGAPDRVSTTPPTEPTESAESPAAIDDIDENPPISWNHSSYSWVNPSHPLIGRVTLPPNSSDKLVFEYTVTREMNDLFMHHIIQGVPVIPGAVYFELLAAMALRSAPFIKTSFPYTKTHSITVNSVDILRPIILSPSYSSVLDYQRRIKDRLLIKSEIFSDGHVTMSSRNVPTASKSSAASHSVLTNHVDASISVNTFDTSNYTMDSVMKSFIQSDNNGMLLPDDYVEQSVDYFYNESRKVGLHLGSRFQTLVKLAQAKDAAGLPCVLCKLGMETTIEPFENDFLLHPSILDGAIQSSSGLVVTSSAASCVFVPVQAKQISYSFPSTQTNFTFYSKATLLKTTDKWGVVKLEVFDSSSKVRVVIEELRLQKVAFKAQSSIPSDMLWCESWAPTTPPPVQESIQPTPCFYLATTQEDFKLPQTVNDYTATFVVDPSLKWQPSYFDQSTPWPYYLIYLDTETNLEISVHNLSKFVKFMVKNAETLSTSKGVVLLDMTSDNAGGISASSSACRSGFLKSYRMEAVANKQLTPMHLLHVAEAMPFSLLDILEKLDRLFTAAATRSCLELRVNSEGEIFVPKLESIQSQVIGPFELTTTTITSDNNNSSASSEVRANTTLCATLPSKDLGDNEVQVRIEAIELKHRNGCHPLDYSSYNVLLFYGRVSLSCNERFDINDAVFGFTRGMSVRSYVTVSGDDLCLSYPNLMTQDPFALLSGFKHLVANVGDPIAANIKQVQSSLTESILRQACLRQMKMKEHCFDFSIYEKKDNFLKGAAFSSESSSLILRFPSVLQCQMAATDTLKLAGTDGPLGTYVITGGLGGLGLLVAHWVILEGVKNIVITTRNKVDKFNRISLLVGNNSSSQVVSHHTIGSYVADKYSLGLCNLYVVGVDCGNQDAVNELIDGFVSQSWILRGFIHCAGCIEDSSSLGITSEAIENTFSSKTRILETFSSAFAKFELNDLIKNFVVFSSVAALLGNYGQSVYAAANSAMDNVITARREAGYRGLSIQWGPWLEQGMAARFGEDLTKEGGFVPISNDVALRVLEWSIANQNAHPIVSCAKFVWKDFLSRIAVGGADSFISSYFSNVQMKASSYAEGTEEQIDNEVMAKLKGKSSDEILTFVKSVVLSAASNVIGHDNQTEIPYDESLVDLGIDSLGAVEFRNVLIQSLGVRLPPTALFDYPTLESITLFAYSEVMKGLKSGGGGVENNSVLVRAGHRNVSNMVSPIAIVGVSCRLPGNSRNPESFWSMLISRTDCVSEIPISRFNISSCYDPCPETAGASYVRHGAFIKDAEWFSPSLFNMSYSETTQTDPQQRLILEMSLEAIASSGIRKESLQNKNVGVIIGCCNFDWHYMDSNTNAEQGSPYSCTGGSMCLISNRLSYVYGVKGPSMTIDTACSSSLVAVDVAMQKMSSGACDGVIAGGVNLILSPQLYIGFSKSRMLSPNGRCRTFDASADGYAKGEGAGCIFLMRCKEDRSISDSSLWDKTDDIQIFGYVLGTNVNHVGRSSTLTAPHGPTQVLCIEQALANSSVMPHEVCMLECHGTGTPLGDPIETSAIVKVFGKSSHKSLVTGKSNPLYLGALKSNIGHLEGGAGIAGLIKLMLCLEKGSIPPNLHFTKLNPNIDFEDANIVIPTETCKLSPINDRYIGGVSSYGFGGANAHVVLEGPKTLVEHHRSSFDFSSTRTKIPWVGASHALIGRRLSFDDVSVYYTLIRDDVREYFKGHTIDGSTILPGAAFLELVAAYMLLNNLCSAKDFTFGPLYDGKPRSIKIPDLNIMAPLLIPESSEIRKIELGSGVSVPKYLRLIRNGGSSDVAIVCDPVVCRSQNVESETSINARGSMGEVTLTVTDTIEVGLIKDAIQNTSADIVDVEPLYKEMFEKGYHYSGHFKCMTSTYFPTKFPNSIVCTLESQADMPDLGFIVPPHILDGAFQSAIILAAKCGKVGFYVPTRIHDVTVVSRQATPRYFSYCSMVKNDLTSKSPPSMKFRVFLYNEKFELLVSVSELHVQYLDSPGHVAIRKNALWNPTYVPLESTAEPASRTKLKSLVILRDDVTLTPNKNEEDMSLMSYSTSLQCSSLVDDNIRTIVYADSFLSPDVTPECDAWRIIQFINKLPLWATNLKSAFQSKPDGTPLVYPTVIFLERAPSSDEAFQNQFCGGSISGMIQSASLELNIKLAPENIKLHLMSLEYPDTTLSLIQLSQILPTIHELAEANHLQVSATEGFDLRSLRTKKLLPLPMVCTGPMESYLKGNQRGALSNLCIRPFDARKRKSPPTGCVEVRVRAVGLNFRDVLNVMGLYPGDPGMPGADFAGNVVAVGQESSFAIGDRVYGLAPGALKTFVVTHSNVLSKIPSGLTYEEASALPVIGVTALHCIIDLGSLKRGQKVLIHAATGGVGLIAIQLSMAIVGAENIVASVGSEQKRTYLRNLGITNITSSRSLEEFTKDMAEIGKVDLVINSFSGDYIRQSVDCLNEGGVFVEIGKRAIWTETEMLQYRPDIHYHIVAVDSRTEESPEWFQNQLSRLSEYFEQNHLTSPPLSLFRISTGYNSDTDGITAGFRFLQQAKHIGKVVIRIPSPLDSPIISTSTIRNQHLPEEVKCNLLSKKYYVITGGLGGMGSVILRSILDEAPHSVTITTRSNVKDLIEKLPSIMPSGYTLHRSDDDAILLLIKGVVVEIRTANLMSQNDIEALMQPRPGLSFGGLFHCAGMLSDGAIDKMTEAKVQDVYRSKVDSGIKILSFVISREIPIDFIVFASSIASSFGNLYQINYSGANSMLDCLARLGRKKNVNVFSLQWGPWTEQGMAVEFENMLEEAGLKGVTNDYGSRVLHDILCYGVPGDSGVVTVAPIIPDKFLDKYLVTPSAFSCINALAGDSGVSEETLNKLADMDDEGIREFVSGVLDDAVKKVVETQDAVPLDVPLTESGIDSLGAVEFSNELSARLGVKFPATTLFNYPTIRLIREFLIERVTAAAKCQQGTVDTVLPLRPTPSTLPYHNSMNTGVAVVGMACEFPGYSNGVMDYWKTLREQVDCVIPVPPERFSIDEMFDPDPRSLRKCYVREGAFIGNPESFDRKFFNISVKETLVTDPQQRRMLEIAYDSLVDAGYRKSNLVGKNFGVYVGCCNFDWHVLDGPKTFECSYSSTGSATSLTANRVSYCLGLRGPSLVVDTACSSSLIALDAAVEKMLSDRSITGMLVGGVNMMLAPHAFAVFCRTRMLSPTCRCKTFDEAADGYVRGEGTGCVVLMRLEEAELHLATKREPIRRILAVVRGTAANHDGQSASLTAPNGISQQLVIESAIQRSGLNPSDISIVECHGTGTALGDPIEAAALKAVYCGAGRSKNSQVAGSMEANPLYLTAVKTNIGHLEGSAGVAGFIKLCLMLRNNHVPPNLHFKKLNPHIDWEDYNVIIPVTNIDLSTSGRQTLVGGLSSFGFGGANSHVIVEAYPSYKSSPSSSPTSIYNATKPKVVFMYTGQGSHYNGMCRHLLEEYEVIAKKYISEFMEYNQPRLVEMGFPHLALAELLLTNNYSSDNNNNNDDDDDDDNEEESYNNVNHLFTSQICILVCQSIITLILRSKNITPDLVLGHSLGELSAIQASLASDDAIKFSRVQLERCYQLYENSKDGAMVALKCSADDVARAVERLKSSISSSLSLAAINGPLSVVVSGTKNDLEKMVIATDCQNKHRYLKVTRGYHSDLVKDAADNLKSSLSPHFSVTLDSTPTLISTLTADVLAEVTPEYLSNQLLQPVAFHGAILKSTSLGGKLFVEIGSTPTLSSMLKQIIGFSPSATDYVVLSMASPTDELAHVSTINNLNEVYHKEQLDPLMDYSMHLWHREKFNWPRSGFPGDANFLTPSAALHLSEASEDIWEGIVSAITQICSDVVVSDLSRQTTTRDILTVLDSLAAVEFKDIVEQRYSVELLPTLLFDYSTLGEICDHVTELTRNNNTSVKQLLPNNNNNMACKFVISSMAFRLPKARTFDDVFDLSNKPSVSFEEITRFPVELCYGTNGGEDNIPLTYNTCANLFPEVTSFNASYFNISHTEATMMDPHHRLVLELCDEAIISREKHFLHKETSNYATARNMGVFIGFTDAHEWQNLQANSPCPRNLPPHKIPPLEHRIIGSACCMMANRVSYSLNLIGPSVTLDSGCSSFGTSLSTGINALLANQCSSVLVGGVSLVLTPTSLIAYSANKYYSKNKGIRSFDTHSDGILRGEGGACFIVETSDSCLRSNSKPIAYIDAAAINHSANFLDITTPSRQAQTALFTTLLSCCPPDAISYYESHGMGLVGSDVTEMSAIKSVFSRKSVEPSEFIERCKLNVGSIHPNFGHLNGAMGACQLLKAIIVLHKGVAPQLTNFVSLHKHIDIRGCDISFPTESMPLESFSGCYRALINTIGMGGTNSGIVVRVDKTSALHATEQRPTNYASGVVDFPYKFAPGSILRPVLGFHYTNSLSDDLKDCLEKSKQLVVEEKQSGKEQQSEEQSGKDVVLVIVNPDVELLLEKGILDSLVLKNNEKLRIVWMDHYSVTTPKILMNRLSQLSSCGRLNDCSIVIVSQDELPSVAYETWDPKRLIISGFQRPFRSESICSYMECREYYLTSIGSIFKLINALKTNGETDLVLNPNLRKHIKILPPTTIESNFTNFYYLESNREEFVGAIETLCPDEVGGWVMSSSLVENAICNHFNTIRKTSNNSNILAIHNVPHYAFTSSLVSVIQEVKCLPELNFIFGDSCCIGSALAQHDSRRQDASILYSSKTTSASNDASSMLSSVLGVECRHVSFETFVSTISKLNTMNARYLEGLIRINNALENRIGELRPPENLIRLTTHRRIFEKVPEVLPVDLCFNDESLVKSLIKDVSDMKSTIMDEELLATRKSFLSANVRSASLKQPVACFNDEKGFPKLTPLGYLSAKTTHDNIIIQRVRLESLQGGTEFRNLDENMGLIAPFPIINYSLTPVFIVGFDRIACSMLQLFLQSINEFHCLSFESMLLPLGGSSFKPVDEFWSTRQFEAEQSLSLIKGVVGETYSALFPNDIRECWEDTLLLELTGKCLSFGMKMGNENYVRSLIHNPNPEYDYYHNLINCILSKSPPKEGARFLVLNSSYHMPHINEITNIFPNAKFIFVDPGLVHNERIERCAALYAGLSRAFQSNVLRKFNPSEVDSLQIETFEALGAMMMPPSNMIKVESQYLLSQPVGIMVALLKVLGVTHEGSQVAKMMSTLLAPQCSRIDKLVQMSEVVTLDSLGVSNEDRISYTKEIRNLSMKCVKLESVLPERLPILEVELLAEISLVLGKVVSTEKLALMNRFIGRIEGTLTPKEDMDVYSRKILSIPWESATRACPPQDIQNFLISAVTGFLGCYVLCDLLGLMYNEGRRVNNDEWYPEHAAPNRIFAIVRKHNSMNSLERVVDSMVRMKLETFIPLLNKAFDEKKLIFLDCLVSSIEGVNLLTDIDAVIHTSGHIDFFGSYEACRTANIVETYSLIQFCLSQRLKHFHYVSTLGIFKSFFTNFKLKDSYPLLEGVFPDYSELKEASMLFQGYPLTKWVAEYLVRIAKFYCNKLPVAIYRLGHVFASENTGFVNTNDLLVKCVQSVVQEGLIPPSLTHFSLTSVEPASDTILSGVYSSNRNYDVYHVINPKVFCCESYFNSRSMYKAQFCTAEDFVASVKARGPDSFLYSESHHLDILRSVWFNVGVVPDEFHVSTRNMKSDFPKIDWMPGEDSASMLFKELAVQHLFDPKSLSIRFTLDEIRKQVADRLIEEYKDPAFQDILLSNDISHDGMSLCVESFKIIKSMNDASPKLSFLGQMGAVRMGHQYLTNIATMKWLEMQNPSKYESQEVKNPVFIMGLNRSGTTLIQRLIGLNPEVRVLSTTDALTPYSYSDEEVNKTIVNEMLYLQLSEFDDWAKIHTRKHDLPEEDFPIFEHFGRSPSIDVILNNSSYREWLMSGDEIGRTYPAYKRFLQHLESIKPSKNCWVLKQPFHMLSLEALFETFPNSRVVVMHRDPMKVVPSWISLVSTARKYTIDKFDTSFGSSDIKDVGAQAMELMGTMADRLCSFREAHPQLESQFYDLSYRDLVSSSKEKVLELCEKLNIPTTESYREDISNYLKESSTSRTGYLKEHDSILDSASVSSDDIRIRFQKYVARYKDFLQ